MRLSFSKRQGGFYVVFLLILFVVTNEDYKFEVKRQFFKVDPVLTDSLLTEPEARHTLPAIALAAIWLFRRFVKNRIASPRPSLCNAAISGMWHDHLPRG
jgi:hypothetical protein